jgi:hypothetical protein
MRKGQPDMAFHIPLEVDEPSESPQAHQPIIKTVWVCGQYHGEYLDEHTADHDGIAWELQGVFTTEALAIAACRDNQYFIGPMTLNESLPHNKAEWIGCYYPLATKH